jgi:hypothetical protein
MHGQQNLKMWILDWKEGRNKWSWPNCKLLSWNFPRGTMVNHENLSLDSWCFSRVSNQAPSEYKSDALQFVTCCSVVQVTCRRLLESWIHSCYVEWKRQEILTKMYGERISETFREKVFPNAILQRVFGELYMAGAVQIKIQEYASQCTILQHKSFTITALELRHVSTLSCGSSPGSVGAPRYTVVKVLRYKSESGWFDPRCHGIFHCRNPSYRTMALGLNHPLT